MELTYLESQSRLYNDKFRYICNYKLTGTKPSLKRRQLIKQCTRTLHLTLQETSFEYLLE